MSNVDWRTKDNVLIGIVNVTNVVDDQLACRVTEDLQDGVSEHVLHGGSAAIGADTKVLVDFSALQGASASLASRVGQLIETWHDLNIALKLCAVPYDVLEAFESTGTDRLVKIYDTRRRAMSAFNGADVPTVTTATAKKPEKKAPRKSKKRKQFEVSPIVQKVGGGIAALAMILGGYVLWQNFSTTKYNIAPVSGTLRVDDQPFSGATVVFEPIGTEDNPFPGPASYGVTNDSGEFSLTTALDSESGAVVGNHRVRLIKEKEGAIADPDIVENINILPSEYNVKTTLTFLVPPEGTQEANIDVKLEPEELETEASEAETSEAETSETE